jgi:hypothetical protein
MKYTSGTQAYDYQTYEQGVADAQLDLMGGWVTEHTTAQEVIDQLTVAVGATPEYIQGYLTVVGV